MIETTILSNLINNDVYTRKVLPYIQKEYFNQLGDKIVFSLVKQYFTKYNQLPTKNTLVVELTSKNLNENSFNAAEQCINNLTEQSQDNLDWLVDTTEEWCKKRAFFNAIVSASDLLEKDDSTLYHSSLDTVKDALSVSFDSHIGSDYIEDAEHRYDSYKEKYDRVPTSFEMFNKVTSGGFVKPSLTVFMAPTGIGKSLFLCNFAADFLKQGLNVLYITLEMSEDQVEKRIDQNLLDLTDEELVMLDKVQFVNRIAAIKKKTVGKLITKEFPSGQGHSGHFRYLVEELKLKKDFKPDVIIIDYINICGSAKITKASGLYEFIGQVCVEIRGLGQEFRCPIFSATQANREGTKAGDFNITDVAESWGLPHHTDYLYGIVENEELAKLNQMKIKRLKDRYKNYHTWYPSFVIGVDKDKQRIYDIVEESVEQQPHEYENEKFGSLVYS